MTTFADAVTMNSEKYNHIRANAALALTTAEIYLQSAVLLPSFPDPDPGDPMDVDNVGEHTPSEAAIDNDPDTHEQTPSDEANDNNPGMLVADD